MDIGDCRVAFATEKTRRDHCWINIWVSSMLESLNLWKTLLLSSCFSLSKLLSYFSLLHMLSSIHCNTTFHWYQIFLSIFFPHVSSYQNYYLILVCYICIMLSSIYCNTTFHWYQIFLPMHVKTNWKSRKPL